MNDTLYEALAQLNLQPGQYQRVQVNGYAVEIHRPVEEESAFAEMVMLEPWVEFPRPVPVGTLIPCPGKLPLPDPPIIPPDDEGVKP